MNVAVIGASDNPEKYSYLAVQNLKAEGHTVFPVHQSIKEIQGLKVYASIKDIPAPIDTVSLYVSAPISSKLAPDILAAKPRRILFNPGAENPEFEKEARARGILVLEACTLVLLKTHQF